MKLFAIVAVVSGCSKGPSCEEATAKLDRHRDIVVRHCTEKRWSAEARRCVSERTQANEVQFCSGLMDYTQWIELQTELDRLAPSLPPPPEPFDMRVPATSTVVVRVLPSGLQLAGAPIDLPQLERHLREERQRSRHPKLVVERPRTQEMEDRAVDVAKAARLAGITQVDLVLID